MAGSPDIGAIKQAGITTINRQGNHDHTLIPLQQEDVVFQQMFEYPVADFEAEVGFYTAVFGFQSIALDDEYALFTHPQHAYCISFRKVEDAPPLHGMGLKLLLMTRDITGADAHLEQTGLVTDREIRKGSPVQDVIYFSTPAGVQVEIWEDPS